MQGSFSGFFRTRKLGKERSPLIVSPTQESRRVAEHGMGASELKKKVHPSWDNSQTSGCSIFTAKQNVTITLFNGASKCQRPVSFQFVAAAYLQEQRPVDGFDGNTYITRLSIGTSKELDGIPPRPAAQTSTGDECVYAGDKNTWSCSRCFSRAHS